MFKYSKDGVSVLTILDTRRAKINGLFQLKFKSYLGESRNIILRGKNCQKKTGIDC